MPDDLPDRSEVAMFDTGKLKHVETQEKAVLPSQKGQSLYFCHILRPYLI